MQMNTAEKILSRFGVMPKGAGFGHADPAFITGAGPEGGVSFAHERYALTGSGYEICVYVSKFPKKSWLFWLDEIIGVEDAVCCLDISTQDKYSVQKNISRSMEEQSGRMNTARSNTEYMDAEQQFTELSQMYREISVMGDAMKILCARIYLSAGTLKDADEKTRDMQTRLDGAGFRGCVCLDETRADFRALFLPFRTQQQTTYRRKEQPVLSSVLAEGASFHYSRLSDPLGCYYGITPTGGSVYLDFGRVTDKRMSYDGAIVGKKGSGKSTLIKRAVEDRAMRGDIVRVFDPTGEFKTVVEELGGKTIGFDAIINVLQILRTHRDPAISYSRHFSKAAAFYRYLNPDAENREVLMMEKTLRKLYVYFGFVTKEGKLNGDVTACSPEKYPLWSDFLALVRHEISALSAAGAADGFDCLLLKNIELVIDNLIAGYGHIFNGYTTVSDIYGEQIVRFDIAALVNMKPEIFDAQLFNELTLCWDNCLAVGRKMKDLFDSGQIEEEDITHFFVFLDEVHRIVNANKLVGVEQLSTFIREARKYFGGIFFATPSLRDLVPENASQANADQIKNLFELTTYKFIMQQDAGSRDLIRRVFGSTFTAFEMDEVTRLSKGQTILSISGEHNLTFDIDVTDEELARYTGGA
jgi:hypothetical protein